MDSEDSDQTGWMPKLIPSLLGSQLSLLVLSCCGSFQNFVHQDGSSSGGDSDAEMNSLPCYLGIFFFFLSGKSFL